MNICVVSGSRGGTGKTTFSFILAHVLEYIFNNNITIVNLSKIPYKIKTSLKISDDVVEDELAVLDFPAFRLDDRNMLSYFLRCKNVVFVADEDPHTLASAKFYLKLTKTQILGIIINMVIKKPRINYLFSYRKLGSVYVVPFDESLRIYRASGVDPIKIRSPAVVRMIKAAVDVARKV